MHCCHAFPFALARLFCIMKVCTVMHVLHAAGVIVLLKYPYPHHVSEPTEYDFIKVHAQMGRASRNSDKKQALSVRKLQPCIP